MSLPTNNSRPKIPYQPKQVLSDNNRYGVLGQFPPTAQQLDGDFNCIIDFLNIQADAINKVAAGILPGASQPENANKVPTTDGNGIISWTFVNTVNLGLGSVDETILKDAAVTSAKIQPMAVKAEQIDTDAVINVKIMDGAITTSKLANNAVTNINLAENAVTTGKLANLSVTAEKIAVGAVTTDKIASNTITSDQLQSYSVTANKIPYKSITLDKLVQATNESIIAGTLSYNGVYYEVPIQQWEIPTRNPIYGQVRSTPLETIYNNSTDNAFSGAKLQEGTVSGTKLTNATVTKAKLQNAGQMVPFAMCSSDNGGTLLRKFNVSNVTWNTGELAYDVDFITSASSANAVVIVTPNDGSTGTSPYFPMIAEQTTTYVRIVLYRLNGFRYQAGFDLIVYDF